MLSRVLRVRPYSTTAMSAVKLYTANTPNGRKVGIAAKELGIDYEFNLVDFKTKQQKEAWFVDKVNPNGKIPAIVDPAGPNGKEVRVFESGAILQYLAEKTGKLLPSESKYEAIAWVYLVNTGLAPNLGNYFTFVKGWDASKPVEEVAAKKFTDELARILTVIDDQLKSHEYLAGSEYTIADINLFGWVGSATAAPIVEPYPAIKAWVAKVGARPAVQAGVALFN